MITRTDEIKIMKEKANFIFNNSGVIYTKLLNQYTFSETSNILQTLLLCNSSIQNFNSICTDLISKKENFYYENNSYKCAIGIIFEICNQVNSSNLDISEQKALRNILRQYTRYFKIDENYDLRNNNHFIKIKDFK